MDDAERRAAEALWRKSGLRSPFEVTGLVYRRYRRTDLGPAWRKFEVETLGLPLRLFVSLERWRGGPTEIDTDSTDVLLLRFRLVRHTRSGIEVGAHWHPNGTPQEVIETWDGPHCSRFSLDGMTHIELAVALLRHRAWKHLRRPTTIPAVHRGRLRIEEDPDSRYHEILDTYHRLKQADSKLGLVALANRIATHLNFPVSEDTLKKYLARERYLRRRAGRRR